MTRLGILGGSHLARMLTQASISLGIQTVIYERFENSPAGCVTRHSIAGAWDDEQIQGQFVELCDVATLDNEFIDASVLAKLEASGLPVYPTSATMTIVQDKLKQFETLRNAGIPVADFTVVESPENVVAAAQSFGWPVMLKARRGSYNGYGNLPVANPDEVSSAWEALAKYRHAGGLLATAWVQYDTELTVTLVRGRQGEIRTYSVAQTAHQDGICTVIRVPAPLPVEVRTRATELAVQAAQAIDGIGVMGVELFLMPHGELLVNEVAPRPHNAGHFTIEGCETSQFENHIRAVLGWPLGITKLRVPSAVVVNILGKREGEANPDGARRALSVGGAHVHMYGKRLVREGRKMGHITVLADTMSIEEAEASARHAEALVDL